MTRDAHVRTMGGNVIAVLIVCWSAAANGQTPPVSPRFFPDDPIATEVDTEDAAGVREREIDIVYEVVESLFADRGSAFGPALNVNTIDEVPDSSWFTNRLGSRPVTAEEVATGPDTSAGPAPGPWTVERGKTDGITPGLRIRDTAGVMYFIKFDPPGFNEMATGAEVVVTKLLYALGYHVPENYIGYIRREHLVLGEGARKDFDDGRRRPMTEDDVDLVLGRAAREPDGSYRVLASKAVVGRPIGGFRFYGTRPDDPNDIVPHDARRELRGLRAFAAWVNHVDSKGSNSLDTVVAGPHGELVRHHLLDFGSTLGSAAVRPQESWEGSEYLFDERPTLKGMVGLGLPTQPWMRAPGVTHSAVGRFDGESFDPETWKPRLPNAAFLRARPDDLFWAAVRMAAFTDDLIAAAVASGQYTDSAASEYITRTLIQRRDKIVRAWLTAANPIVNVEMDAAGVLTFDNAAVRANVAISPAAYRVVWHAFDNSTDQIEEVAEATSPTPRFAAPSGLPSDIGAMIRIDLSAVDPPQPSWTDPAHAYFQRTSTGWRLIGFTRLPEGEAGTPSS